MMQFKQVFKNRFIIKPSELEEYWKENIKVVLEQSVYETSYEWCYCAEK